MQRSAEANFLAVSSILFSLHLFGSSLIQAARKTCANESSNTSSNLTQPYFQMCLPRLRGLDVRQAPGERPVHLRHHRRPHSYPNVHAHWPQRHGSGGERRPRVPAVGARGVRGLDQLNREGRGVEDVGQRKLIPILRWSQANVKWCNP